MELRIEDSKRKHKYRDRIINANDNDKRLFHQLIRRQRKKGNIYVTDLHVGDEIFEGEDVLDGWLTHFSKLAEPSNNPENDYDHLSLCEMDYDAIKDICKNIPPRKIKRSEIERAINRPISRYRRHYGSKVNRSKKNVNKTSLHL